MAIMMAGIDHTMAGLDARSCFSFTKKRIREIYDLARKDPEISGCVLLSTCNRMEMWITSEDTAEQDPAARVLNLLQMDDNAEMPGLFALEGEAAVHRLFRVAAGLESRIIGEGQIITQVSDAITLSRSCYASDHTLEVLFRKAVTAGKKVRTRTNFSTADRSVIRTALEALEQEGFSVTGKRCMVIGNGMMGRICAQTLMDAGADVTVTVRQYHSGMVDIPPGCVRIDYGKRLELIPSCELVVSATASPNCTLKLEEARSISMDHPLWLVDLAVPRDIEKEIAELPWARLRDIDSFSISPQSERLQENIRLAENILEEEEKSFYEWYEGRDLIPKILRIRENCSADTVWRMSSALKNLHLPENEKQVLQREIAGACSRMMNRLLFDMRARLPDDRFRECIDIIEEDMQRQAGGKNENRG